MNTEEIKSASYKIFQEKFPGISFGDEFDENIGKAIHFASKNNEAGMTKKQMREKVGEFLVICNLSMTDNKQEEEILEKYFRAIDETPTINIENSLHTACNVINSI